MQPHHFSSQIHDADNSAYIKHQKVIQEQAKKIAELEKKLEDVQNTMATENVDLGMENHNLKQRIKELESENEILSDDYYEKKIRERDERINELEMVISKMETTLPKWISVDEKPPEYSYMLWVAVENDNKPRLAFYDGIWLNAKAFPCDWNVTHWMYCKDWLPPTPTTEKS